MIYRLYLFAEILPAQAGFDQYVVLKKSMLTRYGKVAQSRVFAAFFIKKNTKNPLAIYPKKYYYKFISGGKWCKVVSKWRELCGISKAGDSYVLR